jgi:hypothetical protein
VLVANQVEEAALPADVPAQRAESAADDQPFGLPGRQFDRRSPFFIGMSASAGVAVPYGLIQLILTARSVDPRRPSNPRLGRPGACSTTLWSTRAGRAGSQ